MKVLKLSHYCIAIDLLGFGQSPKPPHADYSIIAQARRIIELADSLDLERFSLLGHSMGAQIALSIAILTPERVDYLLTVAAIVSGKITRRMKLSTVPWINLGKRSPIFYDLKRFFSRSPLLSNIVFRQWFNKMNKISFESWKLDRDMATQREMHISAYKTLQDMCTLDLKPDLVTIKQPVLAIAGMQDGSVQTSESQLIHKLVHNSRLSMIDECGHYPMYEQRDTYLDAVLSFLRQTETL